MGGVGSAHHYLLFEDVDVLGGFAFEVLGVEGFLFY